MFGALALYCWKFGWFQLADTREAWGQFGDYFGGILNPIISAAAFYWLASSILLQKQELVETRAALEDTQLAQQELADTTLITAKLNKANIRLSVIASQLVHSRTREAGLWEQAKNFPSGFPTRGLKGNSLTIKDATQEVRERVLSLEEDEQKLLAEIEELGKQLIVDVHVTYARSVKRRRRKEN